MLKPRCPFCSLKASLDDAHMIHRDLTFKQLLNPFNPSHGIPVTIVGSKIVEGGLQKQMPRSES